MDSGPSTSLTNSSLPCLRRTEAEQVRDYEGQRQSREEEVRVLHDAITPSQPLQLPISLPWWMKKIGRGLGFHAEVRGKRGRLL